MHSIYVYTDLNQGSKYLSHMNRNKGMFVVVVVTVRRPRVEGRNVKVLVL